MRLTRTSHYAIAALVHLVQWDGQMRTGPDIARAEGIPKPILLKIFSQLVQAGLLTAKKGRGGGLRLAKAPDKITLLEVVESVDGPIRRPITPALHAAFRNRSHNYSSLLAQADKKQMPNNSPLSRRPAEGS
jgi:Rrf2 family protein